MKNKTRLAFEMLSKEIDIIDLSTQFQFRGGNGYYDDYYNYLTFVKVYNTQMYTDSDRIGMPDYEYTAKD